MKSAFSNSYSLVLICLPGKNYCILSNTFCATWDVTVDGTDYDITVVTDDVISKRAY